jgi:hypothetical protein
MTPSDHKYIFYLELVIGGRRAVIVDWGAYEAKLRAHLFDPHAGWQNSLCHILTRVRRQMTNRIVVME